MRVLVVFSVPIFTKWWQGLGGIILWAETAIPEPELCRKWADKMETRQCLLCVQDRSMASPVHTFPQVLLSGAPRLISVSVFYRRTHCHDICSINAPSTSRINVWIIIFSDCSSLFFFQDSEILCWHCLSSQTVYLHYFSLDYFFFVSSLSCLYLETGCFFL